MGEQNPNAMKPLSEIKNYSNEDIKWIGYNCRTGEPFLYLDDFEVDIPFPQLYKKEE